VGLIVLLNGLTVLSWHAATGAAEDKPGTDTLPPDLARLPARSLAMFSVRVADVWAAPLAGSMRDKLGKDFAAMVKDVETKTGLSASDVERATVVMKESPDAPHLLFLATRKAFDRKKVLAHVVPGSKEEKYGDETFLANEKGEAGYVLGDRAIVFGPKADIQTLIDAGKGKQTGGLTPALELAAKKHSFVVGINPAALPPLPDELPAEAEPFKPLLKATSATLAVDLGEKTTAKLRIAFSGADETGAGLKAIEAAQKLALGLLDQGIKELSKDKTAKAIVDILQTGQKSLKAASFERDGSAVVTRLEMKIDQATAGAVAAESVLRVRQAASRLQSQNNLKQIALAMHNYHSTYGNFLPQATYDKDGKGMLSWRVMILPFLEQNDLYSEFKLDEAWDSEHNKKLLAKMPKVYQAPTGKPKHPHGTFYQGFAGKGAFFEGKAGISIADITDGTSNTIMVVEAATDVPWTKPEDLSFVPDKPLPKMGGLYSTPGFNAAFCDGSVRFFSTLKEATLKKYITRNGGEAIGADE
jgi:prepilin-type processing-associated H-X9-DG protein